MDNARLSIICLPLLRLYSSVVVLGPAERGLNLEGVSMGMWVLMLSCLGDPTACNRAVGLLNEARFGNEARCMVEGASIVKTIARTNIDDNIVITYSCRPFTEEDFKKAAAKAKDDDGKAKDDDGK